MSYGEAYWKRESGAKAPRYRFAVEEEPEFDEEDDSDSEDMAVQYELFTTICNYKHIYNNFRTMITHKICKTYRRYNYTIV